MSARTAIIIVNYKTPWHLQECLKSIFEHSQDFHVYVVHNTRDEESVKVTDTFVQKYPDQITVYINEQNLGLVGGVNTAYEQAVQHEYVCFMNSDIIVTPGWLDELVKVLDEDTKAMQVSPDSNQFYREGLIWRLIKWQLMKRFPELGAKLFAMQLKFNPVRSPEGQTGYSPISAFHLFPGGYCNLARNEPFRKRGYYWDPNIIHGYWDDFDTSLYLRQFGTVGGTNKSYVFHFVNVSFDKLDPRKQAQKQRLQLLNGLYVMDKWKEYLLRELNAMDREELLKAATDSYVVQTILHYLGIAETQPDIVDYIRSIPAREVWSQITGQG